MSSWPAPSKPSCAGATPTTGTPRWSIAAQRRERTRARSERHQRWGRPRPPPGPRPDTAYSPGQRTSEDDAGLRLILRKSKTDQEAEGSIRDRPYGSHPATCPVRAWRRWLQVSGINSSNGERSLLAWPARSPATHSGLASPSRATPPVRLQHGQPVGVDRIGRTARWFPRGNSFSVRPSSEPRGPVSEHVALQ